MAVLRGNEFIDNSWLQELMRSLERTFASIFCSDNIVEARAALLVIQGRGSAMNWRHFRLGTLSGAVLVLFFWVLWDCLVDMNLRPSQYSFWDDAAFPVFRCLFCFILVVWAWGVQVYVWRVGRVNFMYIFELDPDAEPSHTEIFRGATEMTIAFFCCFIVFYKAQRTQLAADVAEWSGGRGGSNHHVVSGGWVFLVLVSKGARGG